MKNWKKNLIAAAVLVTVCAGIYLNWAYGGEETKNLSQTLNADKILVEDTLVMGTDPAAGVSADGQDISTATNYFAAIRLSRQEARDSALNLLQEAMAYGDGEKAEASSGQLEQIIQTSLSEAQIESLVIAKGYADCVAYVSDDGVSVAVAAPEGGLQQSDVALITDIVLSQSDFDLGDIRVVEVQ